MGRWETIRDYLYIDDFENFIGSLLAREWPSASFECFNAGSGSPFSINQLSSAVETVSGRPISVRYRPSRSVDTQAVVLAVDKARDLLQWRAMTSIGDGLRSTWTWAKSTQ